MALLRKLAVALVLIIGSLSGVQAQTASDYEALGKTPAAEQQAPGLYDTLQPDDYERVGQDLSMLSATQFSLEKFRSGLLETIAFLPDFFPELVSAIGEKSPTGNASYFLGIIVWILLFFAVAYVIEWQIYGLRVVGPWFVSLQLPDPRGIAEKLPILALRAALGLFGILISLILVGLTATAMLDLSDGATQKTVIVVMVTLAAARASAIIWRMVISPYLPNYRLPRLSDRCARKLFNWLWVSVALSLSLLAFCYWVEDLGGFAKGHKLLTLIATFLMVFINVSMVIANREAISQSFLGEPHEQGRSTWLARVSATFWAPFAILYFLVAWVVMTYRLVMDQPLGPPLIVGAYTVLLAILWPMAWSAS